MASHVLINSYTDYVGATLEDLSEATDGPECNGGTKGHCSWACLCNISIA